MKKNDKLFELIKSMSMSEKRYFKLFISRNKNSKQLNYTILFNAIDELNKYDESRLNQILKKEKVSCKYLAADKNYLYEIILKSLRSFYSGKSATLKVKEYLEYIDILYYKGLYTHCKKLLFKARKIAEAFELHSLLIEILEMERILAAIDADEDNIKLISKKLDTNLQLLTNRKTYNELYHEAVMLKSQYNKARNKKNIEALHHLLDHPLMRDETAALSNVARIKYQEIWAIYYFVTDQKEKEYESNRKIMEIMEYIPEFMQEWPMFYMSIFSRLLTLQYKLVPSDCEEMLKKFRDIPNRVKKAKLEVEVNVFALSYGIEMSILIEELKYDEAIHLVKVIEKGFKKYKNKIPRSYLITAYYRFAYVHFCRGQITDALHYVNKINNEFEESLRPDVFAYAKIFNLIIHYELKNYGLLKYLLKSTRDFLKRRNRFYQTEMILIKFFQKLIRNSTSPDISIPLFEELKIALNDTWENEFEKRIQLYFDFESWMESKITNQALWDIQREKKTLVQANNNNNK